MLPAIAAAADEPQHIFKCTDRSGNITYQNEPCPKDAKAGRIDIFDNRWSATKEEREAEWQRNASQHQLATGMPARWVREALGAPTEVRDTPTAGAAQLWIYNLRERSVQVGMLNDQVLWFRETPASSPGRGAAPADRPAAAPQVTASAPTTGAARASSPPPDLPVMRMVPSESDRIADARAAPAPDRAAPTAENRAAPVAENRTGPDARAASAEAPPSAPAAAAPAPAASAAISAQSVARGQDCKQALAGLGPPDRQRDVPTLDGGSEPATEYFYESASTGRLRIVCANGKIEGVDRSVAR